MSRLVSTLSFDTFQISRERGFLPDKDPTWTFGGDADPRLKHLESLGKELPELLERGRLRPIINRLDLIPPDIFEVLENDELIMAARIYAFLISGYVHQVGKSKVSEIPRSVAVPFSRISKRLGRKYPILSYDLYCLNNWRRVDPKGPISLENMDTIQKFVRLKDEPWFILVHTEIERKAAPALTAAGRIQQSVATKDAPGLKSALDAVSRALSDMISTLRRMPEGNSPEVYAFSFRPYIQMFQDIQYGGVPELGHMPTFRGETGAQSSIVPSLDVALGVKHQRTGLTDYVKDMRNYMPKPHREFIRALEENERLRPLRKHLLKLAKDDLNRSYDSCLQKMLQFREKHLEFAVTYIQNKVPDDSGTGGTPFMKWLAQLRDETEKHKIAN
ncbi:MAG: indoleamine 2,3-dioxygenase [Thaumarchaeota archaeon]|nr:indoleamine 2,3-dioxygenase [Nitrososphaerota archaeon]